MIHTPGVYYSIASATSAYQGKVLAFIGDRKAPKEPTPICLPMLKSWEWHTGDAVTNFDKFSECYAVEANKGTLWTPAAGDGAHAKLKVPNLVAIPTVLINLLPTQGWRSRHTTYWLLLTTLSTVVDIRVINGITSENGAWWQAKQIPMERARCFLTLTGSPSMTRISTNGSETVST